ncbi:hypothetical protein ACRRTK_022781 [Alexandromys fortis]
MAKRKSSVAHADTAAKVEPRRRSAKLSGKTTGRPEGGPKTEKGFCWKINHQTQKVQTKGRGSKEQTGCSGWPANYRSACRKCDTENQRPASEGEEKEATSG